ncbi:hypothetical protein MSG28_015001 [Choristoneura fumiferana]|uniref:Uncharacterized protein n=1 Tax=Choristoneura fumiferana TaxID=7141 RepID=A0ACC0KXU3_CHOFU|nr:hypothetical protein MSG28_015001 [Choristoneura fumiferana]
MQRCQLSSPRTVNESVPVLMALRALLQDHMDHHMHTHVAAHAEGGGGRGRRCQEHSLRFEDWADYLELVNNISNPYLLLEVFFPLVSILDSVFAAQLLLCLGFGGWLNTVMKWWILEDRPYWWVRESTFYSSHRPKLRQTQQTCEPGPGSPSGHSAAAAASIILLLIKCTVRWWKYVLYPLCAGMMVSVFVARLFVAAHFPHQCYVWRSSAFLSPALCIYVSDPFIWRYGAHATRTVTQANGGTWRGRGPPPRRYPVLTYYSLKLCG